jgi:hypothetical protein
MPRKISTIIVFIICNLLINGYLSAQEWTFIKEKDGIKIYTRSVEDNPVKSFKGVTDYKTDMSEMRKVIGRIESFDWWEEDITEIKVLAYEEEKLIRYYLVYDVPWPLSDRDLCVEATITNDSVTGARKVYSVSKPDLLPEKPDKVRIHYYWQQWVMEPAGEGLVHATLEGSVDPAGAIPTWIVNMVITDTPLNVMTKVREQVEGKKKTK